MSLAVLAHAEGDHVDGASLATLASIRKQPERALDPLRAPRLVQEPAAGRFALLAGVQYVVSRRTAPITRACSGTTSRCSNAS